MKNTLLKILLFLSLFCTLSFSQQILKEQYDYALKLYNEEKYFDAVTELKRLLFFDENKDYVYEANLLTGKAYKEGAKLNDAVYHFTLAEINAKNDSSFYDARIELIRANILRRTVSQALKLLDDLNAREEFAEKTDEINYWLGWAHIFNSDFSKAAEYFGKIDPEHELRLLSLNTENEKYSENFAKIISIFIPGAGQIYTGNYFNGFVSLAWNVLSGYLTINSFVEERIFDGIVIGNLLWLRFYLGNIQNAEKFAIDKNLEAANRALEYLQNEYKGIKP